MYIIILFTQSAANIHRICHTHLLHILASLSLIFLLLVSVEVWYCNIHILYLSLFFITC